jgi:hypothetical protein
MTNDRPDRRPVVWLLVVAGIVLIALGAWRFWVGFQEQAEHFLWLDLKAANAKYDDIKESLAKTEARIKEEGDDVTPVRKLARETDLNSQRQLLVAAERWRETIIREAGSKEQKLGFYTIILGLGAIGVAIYQARRPAPATAPSPDLTKK